MCDRSPNEANRTSRSDTARFDWTTDADSPAAAVPAAVAAVRGVDPLTLPPLAHRVDPDALDGLLADASDATVRFTYAGCRVTVSATGSVHVAVRDPGPD